MEKPTIKNMTPGSIMKKPAFKRLLPGGNLSPYGNGLMQGSLNDLNPVSGMPLTYEIVTPEDCMREYDMNAHKIYSPSYYPNPVTSEEYVDENGSVHKRYYEKQLARVAVDLIQMFHTQRTSLLVGSSTDLRMISRKATPREKELFSGFREGWELKNMDNARYELISRAGKTLDSAICCYLDGGEFGWRAFSFEDGDTCFPHYNPLTGRLSLFGRLFSTLDVDGVNRTTYLDVWDDSQHIRYRSERKPGTKEESWVVDKEATPHGFKRCPISYVRYGETFWGNAIRPVDELEMSLSQLLENNKAYALRILVALGNEMEVKASFDGRPVQINGTADSKVSYLEPADASGSFALSLRSLEEQAYIAANCVKQQEIKSGADMSSLTVKMLNQPAYRKAILDALKFQPAIDELVELFKYGYAVELGRSSDYETFHVKARTYPYVMMSESEEVNSLVQLKGTGALSTRSAAEEAYNLGFGSVDEPERILQEAHDELVGAQEQQSPATDERNIVAASRS